MKSILHCVSSFLVVPALLLIISPFVIATPVQGATWQWEAGSVVLPSTDSQSTFVIVGLEQSYAAPPLVFVLVSSDDVEPVSARVRSIGISSFEVVQVEPTGNDGPHGELVLHFVAVEPGAHFLPDGRLIEAGTISTTAVQHGSGVQGSESWDSIAFSSAFAAKPVVVAQIRSMADEGAVLPGVPSEPWLTAALRNVTKDGAQIALGRAEAAAGTVAQRRSPIWRSRPGLSRP